MLKGLVHRVGSLLEITAILAAALACSQLAMFMLAYEQNLAGRLAEAERDVAAIEERAAAAGLPLPAYLEEFRNSDNPIFVREGESLQAKIDRAAHLSGTQNALQTASVLLKPLIFLGRLDPDIAASTWRHFEPAIPLDGASLIYAGLGILIALALIEIVRIALRGSVRFARVSR